MTQNSAPGPSGKAPMLVPPRLPAATPQGIRSALTFYKVLSYTTGCFLLLLCLEMILKYVFGVELFMGATMNDGGMPAFIFAHADEVIPYTGVNLSLTVLIVHGWIYVVYLISCFMLWSRIRWNFTRLVLLALGGVVPLLSFYSEHVVRKNVMTGLKEREDEGSRVVEAV